MGAASFALPRLELDAQDQGFALLAAMALVTLFVIASVRDVILVMIDIAMVFEGVAARLDRLVRPMMAFVTFYALLVVVFACLYRIADLTTPVPQFFLHAEPARISFVDALYYSVATITTLGFGDIAPTSMLVRAMTAIEVVSGVLMLLFGFSEIMRSASADSDGHRMIPLSERTSFASRWNYHVGSRAAKELEHGLARAQGFGHRRGGFSRGQSLPCAGAARRARVALDGFLFGGGANVANLADAPVELVRGDIREIDLRNVCEGAPVIFNLAAQTSHMGGQNDPLADIAVNAVGQVRLIQAAREAAPDAMVVHASTRQFYGRVEKLPVDENQPVAPPDANGVSKFAGEQDRLLEHRVRGRQVVSLRLTNCYGPRLRIRDARQTFLGIWIRCVLEGRPFEVWGGSQLRDLTYVDDVTEAFLLAADKPECHGRIFNIGGAPPPPCRISPNCWSGLLAPGALRHARVPRRSRHHRHRQLPCR